MPRRSELTPPEPRRDAVFHPEFIPEFIDDLRHWIKVDRAVALRVIALVEAVLSDPFKGIGKPEALKHDLAGAWSRRVTQEHRLVYLISEDRVDSLQCRHHY